MVVWPPYGPLARVTIAVVAQPGRASVLLCRAPCRSLPVGCPCPLFRASRRCVAGGPGPITKASSVGLCCCCRRCLGSTPGCARWRIAWRLPVMGFWRCRSLRAQPLICSSTMTRWGWRKGGPIATDSALPTVWPMPAVPSPGCNSSRAWRTGQWPVWGSVLAVTWRCWWRPCPRWRSPAAALAPTGDTRLRQLVLAPGAGHGFMCEARPDFDAAASELGWRTLLHALAERLPA